jgi:hypothetical protein
MYNDRTLHIINTHDTSKPLFLYNAWQEAHTPNEVPDKFLGPDPEAGGIDWPLRRTYEGMLHALDSALGNVTAALKAKQMWDKTIIVFSSAPADALLNDAPCPPCASHGASINRTPESFPALAAPLSRLSAGCSQSMRTADNDTDHSLVTTDWPVLSPAGDNGGREDRQFGGNK